MLAAGTVTFPAAAEELVPEPPLKSRDAKAAEASPGNSTPTTAKDPAPEPAGKSRDAKTTSATRQTEAPPPESKGGTSCEKDCDVKPPVESNTSVPSPIEPQLQVMPSKDLATPPPPTTSETNEARRQLGHALGIGGIVAAAMGTYLTLGALGVNDGTQAAGASGLNGFFFAGLACIGLGGGLMIGGFSMAAANGTPSTAVDRMPAVAQRRALTDMGVSLTGSF